MADCFLAIGRIFPAEVLVLGVIYRREVRLATCILFVKLKRTEKTRGWSNSHHR